jgi:hypothetical protein
MRIRARAPIYTSPLLGSATSQHATPPGVVARAESVEWLVGGSAIISHAGSAPAVAIQPATVRAIQAEAPRTDTGAAVSSQLTPRGFWERTQGGGSAGASGTTTLSFSFPSSVAVGDLIVVACEQYSSTTTTFTVTDSNGNNYNQAIFQSSSPTYSQVTVAIYYTIVSAGGAGLVVTVVPSTSAFLNIACWEYNPLPGYQITLDGAVGTNNNSTFMLAGSITTTGPFDVVVFISEDRGGVGDVRTAGAPLTMQFLEATSGFDLASFADAINWQPGSVTGYVQIGSAVNYTAAMAAFKALPSPPPDALVVQAEPQRPDPGSGWYDFGQLAPAPTGTPSRIIFAQAEPPAPHPGSTFQDYGGVNSVAIQQRPGTIRTIAAETPAPHPGWTFEDHGGVIPASTIQAPRIIFAQAEASRPEPGSAFADFALTGPLFQQPPGTVRTITAEAPNPHPGGGWYDFGQPPPLTQQPPGRPVIALAESFAVALSGSSSTSHATHSVEHIGAPVIASAESIPSYPGSVSFAVNHLVLPQQRPGQRLTVSAEAPPAYAGWTYSFSAAPPFVAPSIFFVHVDPRGAYLAPSDADFTEVDPKRAKLLK